MIVTKLQVELLCLREFARFISRHRRYLAPVMILYLRIFLTWRSTTLLRAAFAFTQGMDDILDADRPFVGSRRAYGAMILQEIRSGVFLDQSAMSQLAQFIITQRPELVPDLAELLEVLIFDNTRMDEKLVLSAQELHQHHLKTFEISCRLLMRLLGKDVAHEVLLPVAQSLAWCSVMRDLEDDLARGLNNIPQHIWSTISRPVAPKDISLEPRVAAWIREEYDRVRGPISQAIGHLKNADSKALLFFMLPVRRYHHNYPQRYGFLTDAQR